jgi:phosphate:Na+ symporter
MTWSMTITFLGGVGLFLLGMKLMTDGLKVAAGNALRDILARGTATTGRGILSGIVITAMVQSSTAVIIATIGFVNAGLMTLFQSVGVIIGSNVGTTATSWLVALIGFNVNIQALAMPAIALGMALRVSGGRSRRGALGEALTGFGIFFLGIDVLRTAFGDVGDRFELERFAGSGIGSLLVFVAIGIVMTVLMNSSSAALAVILTAAGTGVIPLTAAAAMVIGANIGTTSTALFSVIGATPNAKRAAMAMTFFAILTGIVAFVILPLLLMTGKGIAGLLGFEPQPAIVLAIFHTVTKLLGTAMVWPLTPWLVGRLERMFVTAEEDMGRPRHLDHNVAGTPALALEALALELARVGEIARGAASAAINAGNPLGAALEQDKAAIERLTYAVGEFTSEANRNADLPEEIAHAFANGVRITQYYDDMVERALLIDGGGREEIRDPELAAAVNEYRRRAIGLVGAADARRGDFVPTRLHDTLDDCEKAYQEVKQRLIQAGASGRIPVRHMVSRLDELSNIRRILDQAAKAAFYSNELHKLLARSRGADLVK